MKVNQLKPMQGKVDIEVEVVEVGDIREFQKFGKSGRVATATVKDDSGEIKLTLWNEDIDKVKPGCIIKITNGYVSEFQGESQLTAGRFGKLEVIDEKGVKEDQKATKKETKKEEDVEESEVEEENLEDEE